jgi:hypothetical protein
MGSTSGDGSSPPRSPRARVPTLSFMIFNSSFPLPPSPPRAASGGGTESLGRTTHLPSACGEGRFTPSRIPTGFPLPAQGWRAVPTLGNRPGNSSTLKELHPPPRVLSCRLPRRAQRPAAEPNHSIARRTFLPLAVRDDSPLPESQRDSLFQPRVGAPCLPWVTDPEIHQL